MPMPESGIWRWIHPHKRRWYLLLLHQDLFGDWVLLRAWGGLDSRRGGERKEILDDIGNAERLVKEIRRTRLRHGYRPAQPPQGQP